MGGGLCWTLLSLVHASAWLRFGPNVVNEQWMFCMEGTLCSAIQCRAARGLLLFLTMVSGRLMFLGFLTVRQ